MVDEKGGVMGLTMKMCPCCVCYTRSDSLVTNEEFCETKSYLISTVLGTRATLCDAKSKCEVCDC